VDSFCASEEALQLTESTRQSVYITFLLEEQQHRSQFRSPGSAKN